MPGHSLLIKQGQMQTEHHYIKSITKVENQFKVGKVPILKEIQSYCFIRKQDKNRLYQNIH